MNVFPLSMLCCVVYYCVDCVVLNCSVFYVWLLYLWQNCTSSSPWDSRFLPGPFLSSLSPSVPDGHRISSGWDRKYNVFAFLFDSYMANTKYNWFIRYSDVTNLVWFRSRWSCVSQSASKQWNFWFSFILWILYFLSLRYVLFHPFSFFYNVLALRLFVWNSS